MEMLFYIFIWLAIGLWGFIYWWTTEYDLELSNLFIGIIISTIGPGAWVLGWIVHSKNKNKKIVIMEKRKMNE